MSATSEVTEALTVRHPTDKGEWVVLHEVADRCSSPTRYADALAVNLWGSRGHAVHGYEVKVSRSDWLTEVGKPEKADFFVRRCHYWTVAVPACDAKDPNRWARQSIVRPDELPPGWGLAVWTGTRWHNAVRATLNTDRDGWGTQTWASMLRRAWTRDLTRAVNLARQEGYERGVKAGSRDQAARVDAVEASLAVVREFEETLGVSVRDLVRRWSDRTPDGTTLADAVQRLLADEHLLAETARRAEYARNTMRAALRDFEDRYPQEDPSGI